MRVLTIGTFDCTHPGHIELLRECKRLAGEDDVIVGLNTDEFVEQFKGKRPLMSYTERQEILWAIKYVDQVRENTHGSEASHLIESISGKVTEPNYGLILAIGSDWHGDKYLKQLNITWDWLRDRKIILAYIPRKEEHVISTTILKERLNAA